MIQTNEFCKTNFGEFLAIGAKPEFIEGLQFSLYNFGGINSTDLLDIGSPDIFQYLLVRDGDYVKARAKNIVINLEYNYKGNSGKLPWGIAFGRAKKELSEIKFENFLANESDSGQTFSFGWIPDNNIEKRYNKINFDTNILAKRD